MSTDSAGNAQTSNNNNNNFAATNTGYQYIMNAVLCIIKHLMSSRDKLYIQNYVVANFDVDLIFKAREMLFTFLEPGKKYIYRGGNNKLPREKAVHAFEGIFAKLKYLDTNAFQLGFSCPVEELGLLLNFTDVHHSSCNEKFQRMESDIMELRKTFHAYTEIVNSKQLDVSSPITPVSRMSAAPLSAIPSVTRERLESTGSQKRRRSEEDDSYNTANDDSEREDNNDGFEYPRQVRKKIARYNTYQSNMSRSFRDAVKSNANVQFKSNPSRSEDRPQRKMNRDSVWGKAEKSKHLASTTPDVFLFHCDPSSEEEKVFNYFMKKEIGVRLVKLASHKNAVFKSFRITVTSEEDYNKIMSGEYLPENVAVRKFIPPRHSDYSVRTGGKFNDDSTARHVAATAGLDILAASSLRDNAPQNVTSPHNISFSVDTMLSTSTMNTQAQQSKD